MKVLPPTETTRQARRQETLEARQRIARNAALAAASRLFAEKGFHETGMADIARGSGISLKALYGVFASKEDLFVAVLDEAFARLLPVLADDGHDDDPGARILDLIDELFALVDDNRFEVLLYARGSDGVPAALRADGRDPYEPYARVIRDRISELVRTAQAAGHAPGVAADVVAQSLLATILAIARDAVTREPDRSVAEAAPDVRALFAPLFGAA
jgi:AcrR family transcriptional regulator